MSKAALCPLENKTAETVFAVQSIIGDEPLFSVHHVSQHEFRKSDHELSQPRIFLEQRHDVVVGEFVKTIFVAIKPRFFKRRPFER